MECYFSTPVTDLENKVNLIAHPSQFIFKLYIVWCCRVFTDVVAVLLGEKRSSFIVICFSVDRSADRRRFSVRPFSSSIESRPSVPYSDLTLLFGRLFFRFITIGETCSFSDADFMICGPFRWCFSVLFASTSLSWISLICSNFLAYLLTIR